MAFCSYTCDRCEKECNNLQELVSHDIKEHSIVIDDVPIKNDIYTTDPPDPKYAYTSYNTNWSSRYSTRSNNYSTRSSRKPSTRWNKYGSYNRPMYDGISYPMY